LIHIFFFLNQFCTTFTKRLIIKTDTFYRLSTTFNNKTSIIKVAQQYQINPILPVIKLKLKKIVSKICLYFCQYLRFYIILCTGIVENIIHRWIIELGGKVLDDKIYIFSYWN